MNIEEISFSSAVISRKSRESSRKGPPRGKKIGKMKTRTLVFARLLARRRDPAPSSFCLRGGAGLGSFENGEEAGEERKDSPLAGLDTFGKRCAGSGGKVHRPFSILFFWETR